jgi:hypothetical protein
MKTLPNSFYNNPTIARETMTRKDLKELLLSTGGSVMIHGRLWDIKSKNLGAGVYKVTVKLSNP